MNASESNKVLAKRRGSKPFKVLISLSISLACLVWVLWSVETDEIVSRLREVQPHYLLLAVVVTALSYILRAVRWPWFFKYSPPRFVDSFRCLIVGFFMNNILPARIGEFVRAHLGGRATGQSRTYVLATVAGERLVDGVTISVLFALLFTWGASAEQYEHSQHVYYAVYFFGLAALGTVTMLVLRHPIFSIITRLQHRLPGKVSRYALIRAQRFIEGLEPMLQLRRLIPITLWSIAIWMTELLVYYLVSVSYQHPLSIAETGLFLAAVNFSSLLPAAPAGLGVIEAVATAALVQVGVDREAGLVMVATQHLIQFLVVGVPGLYLFIVGLGGKVPKDVETDEGSEGVEPKAAEEPAVSGQDNSDGERNIALSIVVPAYNEEARLPGTLSAFISYLAKRNTPFEIVVVSDGSRDRTADIVKDLSKREPAIRLCEYTPNRGKGFAVRYGMLRARGAIILYSDADGAAPISELERLEQVLREGADVAIGSRALFARDTAVRTVWYRKFLGRIFNGIVNCIAVPDIADTQCGFKLFRREAALSLFSKQSADGFSFDVEILFLAKKAGLRVAEVPINWTNIPGSKVNLLKDSFLMLCDVIGFRLRDLAGRYELSEPVSLRK